MSHRRFHAIEKKQVQLAAVGGLVIVYFFLGSSLQGGDPAEPASPVAMGSCATFAVFAVILLTLAAVAGAVTIGSRPPGALLATLIATGAVSLRSPPLRALLWAHQDNLGLLFAKLIAEVLLLAFLAVCAGLIISLVHRAASRLNPQWAWRELLDKSADKQHGGADRPDTGAALLPLLWAMIKAGPIAAGKTQRRLGAQALLRALYCLSLGVPIAIAMILLVMQSSDRGQTIFALLVSFFVAALVAYQTFPVRSSLPAMAMVVLSAVALYGLAGAMCLSGTHGAWMGVKFFAQALPIDWLTAGGGGAVLGYWVSLRAKEARYCQQLDQKSEQSKGE